MRLSATHSNISRSSSSSSSFMVFGIILLSLLLLLPVDVVMGGGEGSGETASIVNCDESLTSSVVFECPTDDPSTVLMASYVSRGSIDCGGALSIEQAAIAPKIKVTTNGEGEDSNNNAIDPNGLYTLLLVDTTALGGALGIFDGKAQQSFVHPILHYGAVNIEGSALIAGLSLDLQRTDGSSLLDVFSSYRGPNPPQPSDPWAIPQIEDTLFVYEYMLGMQQTQSGGGDNNNGTALVDIPIDIENTQFDYESFFDEVGVDFSNTISTYFVSGWCVEEIEERTRATHTPTTSPPITSPSIPETLSSSSSPDDPPPDPVFASVNNSTNDDAKEDYFEIVNNSNNSSERSSLYPSSKDSNTTVDVDDTTSSSSPSATGTGTNAFFSVVVLVFCCYCSVIIGIF
jgi:hypothetical protein